MLLPIRDEMNEAELLLLVRIGDIKAEVENADAYDVSLPDDDKQTTDPAATAEINSCRRRRVDAAMRRVFFMLYKTSFESAKHQT